MTRGTLSRAALLAVTLALASTGCARMLNGKSRTIFLHMSEDTARNTTFFLDGKQVDWAMRDYSSREVARTSTTVTYQVTRLPALSVPASNNNFIALRARFGDGHEEEMLLKRDLMRGYKIFIYLNWMTMGIGTIVDIYSDSLWGMEEIVINDRPAAAPGVVP